MEKDNVCKTPRWRLLKAVLNNLSAQGFKEKIALGDIILVDVRKLAEFQEVRLPNAIHIDYFETAFWDKITQLDKTKDILVYCRSGRRSIRVCTLMKNGGFDAARIFNLDGGIVEWVEAFPSEVETGRLKDISRG